MAKAATQAEGTASTRDVVDPASIENETKQDVKEHVAAAAEDAKNVLSDQS